MKHSRVQYLQPFYAFRQEPSSLAQTDSKQMRVIEQPLIDANALLDAPVPALTRRKPVF